METCSFVGKYADEFGHQRDGSEMMYELYRL